MARTPWPARMAGMSLVELLVTLTLVGIGLSLAVPSFLGLQARQTVTLERERFGAALNNARLLAISGNQRVVLCPSLDGESCQPDPHWERGWIQFADDNGNRERDTGERLMRYQGPGEPGLSIRSSRNRRRITFQPLGVTLGSNLTLSFCHGHDPGAGKVLVLSNGGRFRRSDRRPDGSPVICP